MTATLTPTGTQVCIAPDPLRGRGYATLVDALDKAGKLQATSFATLNYECILEWVLMLHRRPVAYSGSQQGFVDVWKLHGSCNLMPGPGLHVAPASTGIPQLSEAEISAANPRLDRNRAPALHWQVDQAACRLARRS